MAVTTVNQPTCISPSDSPGGYETTLLKSVDIEGYERGESDGEIEGALVIEESEEDEESEAGALPPLNGRHPFKLSPEIPSPISPEPSAEPPRSLRHIKLDTP